MKEFLRKLLWAFGAHRYGQAGGVIKLPFIFRRHISLAFEIRVQYEPKPNKPLLRLKQTPELFPPNYHYSYSNFWWCGKCGKDLTGREIQLGEKFCRSCRNTQGFKGNQVTSLVIETVPGKIDLTVKPGW